MACSRSGVDGKNAYGTKDLHLKTQYRKYVDEPMCSIVCPCPENTVFVGTNTAYSQYSLANWRRYVDHKKSNAKSYSTNPISTEYLVQLQFAKAGDPDFPVTYSTYKECFNKVLNKSGKQSSNADA